MFEISRLLIKFEVPVLTHFEEQVARAITLHHFSAVNRSGKTCLSLVWLPRRTCLNMRLSCSGYLQDWLHAKWASVLSYEPVLNCEEHRLLGVFKVSLFQEFQCARDEIREVVLTKLKETSCKECNGHPLKGLISITCRQSRHLRDPFECIQAFLGNRRIFEFL